MDHSKQLPQVVIKIAYMKWNEDCDAENVVISICCLLFSLTDVTRPNFFEVARADFFSKY